ncbi:unnamed protein product [Caenorhabditis brenneri]
MQRERRNSNIVPYLSLRYNVSDRSGEIPAHSSCAQHRELVAVSPSSAAEDFDKIVTAKPITLIPNWFLNRQKDIKDGKTGQLFSTAVDNKLREGFERMKKKRLPCQRTAHQNHPSECPRKEEDKSNCLDGIIKC